MDPFRIKSFSVPPAFENYRDDSGRRKGWQDLIEWFRFVLDVAQKERQKRVDWDRYECEAMLSAVNWARAKLDKDPITMRRLIRQQSMAVGHVDYSSKFGLYCAELVFVDTEDLRP